MHRIRAICFDLDNTLWDIWPVIMRAEQEMYEYLQAHYPRIAAKHSIESLRSEREKLVQEEPHMSYDFSYLRRESLRRCAEAAGYPGEAGHIVFDVFYRARNRVTLYRDVLPGLHALRGHYRLLTLTNGNADLAAMGLDHLFDGRFTAREVGALKPDRRAFEHVLAAVDMAPHEVLYVGDDPEADIVGARQLGMPALWMNRNGAIWNHEHGAVPLMVSRVDEMLALLGKEPAGSGPRTTHTKG